jgi:hypothetical protein
MKNRKAVIVDPKKIVLLPKSVFWLERSYILKVTQFFAKDSQVFFSSQKPQILIKVLRLAIYIEKTSERRLNFPFLGFSEISENLGQSQERT